ncbi:hypothetical protein C8R41DRAFT_917549 [Lentinula lateritia]|uniref:Uncharacterized protein n=1 Tax=Lentinula lateritia TaxID=40482 RepID=A0ABQ8VM90_9AGAR|nr:hypothetical protein C8R41DRAFT_917549 [Lentinula lateritia]
MEGSPSEPLTDSSKNVPNIIMASSSTSDVDMYSSTQTIRNKSSSLARTRTQHMEIDSEPPSSPKFHLQSAVEMELHARKRSGFDRINELETELSIKDKKLYLLAADVKLKLASITSLETKIRDFETQFEELQDSIAAQKILYDGACASAQTQDALNQKLSQTNADLTEQLRGWDENLKDLWDRLPSAKEEIKVLKPRSRSNDDKERVAKLIRKLESECHELKVQINSLQGSNQELSRVNQNLEGMKESYESMKELQETHLPRLQENLTRSNTKCSELERDVNNLKSANTVLTVATPIADSANLVQQICLIGRKAGIAKLLQLTCIENLYAMLQSECATLEEKVRGAEESEKNTRTKLLTEIKSLKEENADLNATKSELFSKLEDMQTDIEERMQMFASRQEKMDKEMEKFEQAKNQLDELEADNQQLLNDLDLFKEHNEEYKIQKDKEFAELQRAQSDSASLNDVLIEKQVEIGWLTAVIEDSKRDREKSDAKIGKLRGEVKHLLEDVAARKQANNENEQSVKSTLKTIRNDKVNLQAIIDSLETQLQQACAKNSTVARELSTAREHSVQFHEEKKVLSQTFEQKIQELQDKIEDWKDKYDALDDQLQEALTRNVEVMEGFSNAKREFQQVNQEKTCLFERSGERLRTLEDHIANLKTTNDSLNTQLQEARTQYSMVKEGLSTAREKCHLITEEKEKLLEESKQKERELQDEILKLTDKCSTLDSKLQDAHTQNAESLNEVATGKETSRQLVAEKATLSQQLKQYKEECHNAFEDMKTKCKQIASENAQLTQEANQQRQKLQKEISSLKDRDDDYWVARPRYDILCSRMKGLERTHEATKTTLADSERELETDRNITTQAESQNLILQLNKKTQEMSDLWKEKSSLEAIIKDLQVKLSQIPVDNGLPDQVTVLQQENLKKSLEIQRLERELETTITNSPVGGLGATLAKAPVQAELNRACSIYPQWQLPTAMKAGNHLKPWNEPKSSLYIKSRQKESHNSYLDDESDKDEDEPRRPDHPSVSASTSSSGPSSQSKGKQKQTQNNQKHTNAAVGLNEGSDADDEDGSDEEQGDPLDDENAEPSDVSRVQAQWENLGSKTLDGLNSKKYINKLARDLIREGFNVRRHWAIFTQDGIKLETLENYIKDPQVNGPKLRNARINKFAANVKSMKASPWNRAVAYKFAEKAKEIVANCRDGRFGTAPIDWNKLFNDRLYTVYKDIIDARPLPGETKDDLVLRLALKQDKRKERSANRSILHVKRTSRSDIATIMIKVSRECNDNASIEFWSYGLNVMEILGDQGQSDEEDITLDVEVEGDLIRIMEKAPALEKLLFHRASAKHILRIRSDKLSHRPSKSGYPREFFREDYLSALLPHEVADLNLGDGDFPLINFTGYDPALSGDQAMEID